MFRKTLFAASVGFVLLSFLAVPGCFNSFGPNFGIMSVPIPVSPYFQDDLEDKAWEAERYDKVPVLGPITAGGPAVALDPPSDDEIMRALEDAHPLEGGIPFLHEFIPRGRRICCGAKLFYATRLV